MTDLLSELFDSAKPHILDLFEVKAFADDKSKMARKSGYFP